MATPRLVTWIVLALAFTGWAGGCTSAMAQQQGQPGLGFYDAAPLDDPAVGRCDWLGRARPFVFQENDYIRGYFEPTNLAAYQQALPAPFAMPQQPLIRVTFLDFYDMAEGPTYLETEVAVLGMNGAQPGWVVLTLPVTSGPACIGGRELFGLTKVMRRITLVRAANRYVGTLYARGAQTVDITLTVDVGEPGQAARELLRQYGSTRSSGCSRDACCGSAAPARRSPSWQRAATTRSSSAWPASKFAPDSLLQRLGVGAPLAAHWSRVRVRYSIRAL